MKREQSKNELLVISQINLIEYYNTHIVPLGKATNRDLRPMSEANSTGLCPVHTSDTDPSFHYWKRKQIFHCFGCGFGGDVVKTHRQMRRQYFGENLSIETTVEQLARLFNIELDKDEGFVVKSVFDQARESLLDKQTYIIPRDILSIAEFRQLNNRVRSSSVPQHIKVQNFEHLDVVASVILSNK